MKIVEGQNSPINLKHFPIDRLLNSIELTFSDNDLKLVNAVSTNF